MGGGLGVVLVAEVCSELPNPSEESRRTLAVAVLGVICEISVCVYMQACVGGGAQR